MLIFDMVELGNNIYKFRKEAGMTQSEVAEASGLSGRAYADIERGSVNPRIESVLKICEALSITPNSVLVKNIEIDNKLKELFTRLSGCKNKEKEIVINIINAYLDSI